MPPADAAAAADVYFRHDLVDAVSFAACCRQMLFDCRHYDADFSRCLFDAACFEMPIRQRAATLIFAAFAAAAAAEFASEPRAPSPPAAFRRHFRRCCRDAAALSCRHDDFHELSFIYAAPATMFSYF